MVVTRGWGKGNGMMKVKQYKFSVIRRISSDYLMDSMVILSVASLLWAIYICWCN